MRKIRIVVPYERSDASGYVASMIEGYEYKTDFGPVMLHHDTGAKGWYVYDIATGRKISSVSYRTRKEAETHISDLARKIYEWIGTDEGAEAYHRLYMCRLELRKRYLAEHPNETEKL